MAARQASRLTAAYAQPAERVPARVRWDFHPAARPAHLGLSFARVRITAESARYECGPK